VDGAQQRVVLGEGRQCTVRGRLPAEERIGAQQVGGVLGEAALGVGLTGEHRRHPELLGDEVGDEIGDGPLR
jgi:hypothetical protein